MNINSAIQSNFNPNQRIPGSSLTYSDRERAIQLCEGMMILEENFKKAAGISGEEIRKKNEEREKKVFEEMEKIREERSKRTSGKIKQEKQNFLRDGPYVNK